VFGKAQNIDVPEQMAQDDIQIYVAFIYVKGLIKP